MTVDGTLPANARAVGELTIDAADLKRAASEASSDGFVVEAFQGSALVVLLAINAVSYWRHAVSWPQVLVLCSTAIAFVSARTARAKRARDAVQRIARINGGAPATVEYGLDASGLVIQSGSNAARYAWSACYGFDERHDTILVYFDKLVPDVLFKRAFCASELTEARALLHACVVSQLGLGQRVKTRHYLLALILGIAIVFLGALAALVLRS